MRKNANSLDPSMTRTLWLGMLATATFVAAMTQLVSGAQAAPKIEVCHFPPGNPANFHTIMINANGYLAHVGDGTAKHPGHGDLLGPCNLICATICDDLDACTIDDTGDCEDEGCPPTRTPVDCNDGVACTVDSCTPQNGCNSTPKTMTCAATALAVPTTHVTR